MSEPAESPPWTGPSDGSAHLRPTEVHGDVVALTLSLSHFISLSPAPVMSEYRPGKSFRVKATPRLREVMRQLIIW